MKKIDVVAIGTIAIVACLLFCTPALANYNSNGFPVVTRDSGTVNGGVFIDSVPWADTTTLTGNFNVPNGNIIWARLYTGIWGGRPEYEGWVNVTFNGVDDTNELGPIHLQGQNDANPNVWCSGYGKHWIYYTVTDLVTAGAVNTATTTKINATVGNFDGRVYGIVLVVVYEGGANPKNIQYWINDGSDGLNDQHNDGTTDFAGSVPDSVTNAELTMVHLTAYEYPGCADCLQFNDNVLDTSMIDSNTFELNSWDVASYVESSGNDAWYSRGDDGHVNVCNAILTLESEPEELPDLVISDKWLCWPDNCMICYNVTNIGDGTASAGHNTALYVDDEEVAQDQVPVSLEPGESYTGCFNGYEWTYTPPSDDIKVCADNSETLDELHEDNNCLSPDIWMCGDVNGDHTVNVIDVVLIYKRALDPGYPLDLPWAGDVNCDRNINVIDVVLVYKRALDPGYDLNCCCEVV